MKFLRPVTGIISVVIGLSACRQSSEPPPVFSPDPTVESLIDQVSQDQGTFSNVPFAKVIQTSTGRLIIPFDPAEAVDGEILKAIRQALFDTLEELNRPGSPTHEEARINEASIHFEDGIRSAIGAQPGFQCDYPRTAEGNLQRSGYPDLRIVHESSGRVIYLDPKLVATGSFDSSLRSFYFTPKVQTAKVLDDAHHLLVGIEHDGNTGQWKFLGWHLVDLSDFKVRLKAEFQASNRDLYQPALVIESQKAE